MTSLMRIWRSDAPALVMVGRLAVVVLGLVNTLVIARSIGPAGRGETAAAIAAFYIVPILLALGVPLEVRRRAAADVPPHLRGAYRKFALATFPAAAALAWATETTLFSAFSDGARICAALGVALAPVTVMWMCDASAVLARQRFRAFLVIQIAQPATFLAVTLGVWACGAASTAAVLLASIAGTVLTALTGCATVARYGEGPAVGTVELARGGMRFAGAAVAEAASNRLDQVIALPILGAAQAGLYSVAVTVSSVPLAVGHALGGSYFAGVARAQDPGERHLLKVQAIKASLALGAIVAATLAAAAPLVVPLVFGAAFSESTVPTIVALVGSVAMVGGYVGSQVLAAEGKGRQMTIAQGTSLTVGVALLVVLGAPFGALGAASAATASYLALLVALAALGRVGATSLMPRPRDVRVGIGALVRSGG